jgi:hypothetical protein
MRRKLIGFLYSIIRRLETPEERSARYREEFRQINKVMNFSSPGGLSNSPFAGPSLADLVSAEKSEWPNERLIRAAERRREWHKKQRAFTEKEWADAQKEKS